MSSSTQEKKKQSQPTNAAEKPSVSTESTPAPPVPVSFIPPVNSNVIRATGLPYTSTVGDVRILFRGFELSTSVEHPITLCMYRSNTLKNRLRTEQQQQQQQATSANAAASQPAPNADADGSTKAEGKADGATSDTAAEGQSEAKTQEKKAPSAAAEEEDNEAFIELQNAADVAKAVEKLNRNRLGLNTIELSVSSAEEKEAAVERYKAYLERCRNALVLRLRGLPFLSTEKDIRDFLKTVEGILHVDRCTDNEGQPTGDAFIELEKEENVEQAKLLDGKTMGTRYIEVLPCTATDRESIMAAASRRSRFRTNHFRPHPQSGGPGGYSYGGARGGGGASRGGARMPMNSCLPPVSPPPSFPPYYGATNAATGMYDSYGVAAGDYGGNYYGGAPSAQQMMMHHPPRYPAQPQPGMAGGRPAPFGRGGRGGGGHAPNSQLQPHRPYGGQGGKDYAVGAGGMYEDAYGGGAEGYMSYGAGVEYYDPMLVGGGSGAEFTAARPPSKFVVRVRGLPLTANEDDIADFFPMEVHIVSQGVHMVYNESNLPSGEAFVELEDARAVNLALRRSGRIMDDCCVVVTASSLKEMQTLGGAEDILMGGGGGGVENGGYNNYGYY